jgi:hypothetical protein
MNLKVLNEILSEDSRCPLCGVYNITWDDMQVVSEITNTHIPSVDVCGATYEVLDKKITCGTACWDAPFGDECGACCKTISNQETALVGSNGYCHD